MASGNFNGQYYYGPSTGAFPTLLSLYIAGQIQGDVSTYSILNDGGSAYEIWTAQATGTSAASFDLYPANDPGQKVTISGAAAASATLVATNLLTDFDNNAVAYGLMSSSQLTDTLTLTGRTSGMAIVLDNASNVTLVNGTDAASAERVPAGVAMMRTGSDSVGNAVKGRRMVYTAYTALYATCTYASVGAGGVAGMTVEYGGITRTVEVPYNTSNTQTTTDLYTALETFWNAAFPAGQSVVFTNPSAGVIVATADVAGAAIRVDAFSTGTAAVVWNGDATLVAPWNIPAYSGPAAYIGTSAFESGVTTSSAGGQDAAVPAGGNVRVGAFGPGFTPGLFTGTSPSVVGTGLWTDATGSDSGRGYYAIAALASSKRIPLYLPGRGWLAIVADVNAVGDGLVGVRNLVTNGA
jgi:hypothetical protein